MTSNIRRKNTYEQGLLAEKMAIWFLRLKGYRLLDWRAKSPVGEIDIIMVRGNTVIAVEVKARKTLELAAYSLSERQQKRISKALIFWLQQNPKYIGKNIRFDIVLMGRWPILKHHQNAWLSYV